MFPVVPVIIGQGWEKHEFKFKVDISPNLDHWQLCSVEPHPKNTDNVSRWFIRADSSVNDRNTFLVSVTSKVCCPQRETVFATFYLQFENAPGFRKKRFYRVDREEKFFFSRNHFMPSNKTMWLTIVSETGLKPGFTDILLLDIELKVVNLSIGDDSSTRTTHYWDGNLSRDIQDPTGNDGSRLWIGKWEKFKFIFHSFKPHSTLGIEPRQVIPDDSMNRWQVKLKSDVDPSGAANFQVTARLLSSIQYAVFAKVMYVADLNGKVIRKFECSYHANVNKPISYQLRGLWDIKDLTVKVWIVSDTGSDFRQVYPSSPSDDSPKAKHQSHDRPCIKEEPKEVPDVQKEPTRRKLIFSPDPVPAKSNFSDHIQSGEMYPMNDLIPVNKDESPKERRSKPKAKERKASGDLIGEIAGPSHSNCDQSSELNSSEEIKELSEPKVSSSGRKNKKFKTSNLSDIPSSQEIDTHLDLQYLESWKEKDHKYSVPTLERYLYLYFLRMVTESSSVQQNLHHQSEPPEASSSWKIKIESSVCGRSEVNIRIAATLVKSKINMLFARMLIFIYPGVSEAKYSFEKKQCLYVGESIMKDLTSICISTATILVEVLLLSENSDQVLVRSCEHNVNAGSVQTPVQLVLIQSSTDILEANESALSSCSYLLRAIIHNFESSSQNRVIRMTDFSSKVIQSMLNFINGATEVDWKRKRTKEIFKLSDKYSISDLKEKCESHLIVLLKLKNALELLIFATDNLAEQLKKSALELVCSNNKYFRENHRYNVLCDRPEIMQQVLEHLGDVRVLNKKRKNDSPAKRRRNKKKRDQ